MAERAADNLGMVCSRSLGLAVLALLAASEARDTDGGAQRKEVPPPPPPLVMLSVLAGRASVVQGEQTSTWTRATGRRSVEGEAYVEVGPGGEIELAWPGAASVRARGPAALEWDPERDVRVLRAHGLEAEARRGSVTLYLPLGWRGRLEQAALGLQELPTGELLVEHRGGKPLRLERESGGTARLESGQKRRLDAGR